MQAVSAGLVPILLACMTKGSMALTIASAEALMQITVGVKGKQAMVRLCETLVQLWLGSARLHAVLCGPHLGWLGLGCDVPCHHIALLLSAVRSAYKDAASEKACRDSQKLRQQMLRSPTAN